MDNIRNYIPTVEYLTKKEVSLFLDKPLRIMENKNIIMLCKIFMSKYNKIIIDTILYSIVKHCNYNWINNFEIMNEEMETQLRAWISFLNIQL